MKREELKALGLTDEQIDAVIKTNGDDINNAKKGQLDKKEIERLQERDKLYTALEEANLTDAQKIQKALDEANTSKSEYTKKLNALEVEKIYLAAGMKSEEYSPFLSMVGEDLESAKTIATSFTTTLKAQKDAAEKTVRETLLKETPGGKGGAGGSSETKTVAETLAESVAKGPDNSGAADVIAQYSK